MSNKIDQFKELGGIDEFWFNNFYNESKAILEQKYLKDFFYNLMKKLYGQPPFPQIIINDYNNHLKRLTDKTYNIIECYKILTDRLDLGDFETVWTNALNEVDEKIKLFEEQNPTNKPRIELIGNGRRVYDFAIDIGNVFENNEELFYKPKEQIVVKIEDYFDKMLNREITMFREVKKQDFYNIIESKVITFKPYKKYDEECSPSLLLSELTLCNEQFIKKLYNINRFLKFPLPFIDKKTNEFIIPKKGYDEKREAYFTAETPEVTLIDIEESKKIIENILFGFCFENEIDKTIAISYLITPCCRGLYGDITERTPLYLIKANRERAGKDYLAGIVGILYEGKAIDDTPISDGEKGKQSNDELRKKITAGLIQGRRRFHSSNNKGFLNNSVLEQVLTSKTHRDRILGKTKEVELDNEMEFSMSANWGLTYSADLWNRCRPINLFFSEEDPNERTFTIPDLHGYVQNNRPKILSAIISLIKDWFDNGMIMGETPFTSFPKWAGVVGGIMKHHNFGDPCIRVKDDDVGGDTQTEDIKTFVENMLNERPKPTSERKWFYSKELLDKISINQEEWGVFLHSILKEEPKLRGKVIKIINKYINREFSGIKFKCLKETKKQSGWKYSFEKAGEETLYKNKEIKEEPNQEQQINSYQEHSKKLKINEKPIIEAEEELIEDDSINELTSFEKKELIQFKCSICGESPCIIYDEKSKPLCKNCVGGK